ncbi:dihydrofolate reductase family protein [Microlunatus sp. GCM10028923]|uniref:dihydrofolate reductase family protein n=1 Tax=Microlunatus sp. GCM10028923 TaxID=3273400 RepID=UPI00360EDEF2
MLMSLDGVVQDPGGFGETEHGGWALAGFTEESRQRATEQLERADYFLLGRTTFELLHGAWSANTGPYAERMHALPKLVASTTLRDPLPWNARVIEGDPVAAIAALRQQDGGDIVTYGSVSLVRELLAHGLVDVLEIALYPLVLGTGKHLFGDTGHALRLVDANRESSGVITLTYRRPDDQQ